MLKSRRYFVVLAVLILAYVLAAAIVPVQTCPECRGSGILQYGDCCEGCDVECRECGRDGRLTFVDLALRIAK